MSAMENLSARDAREAIALACRIHGRARGWHIAAQRLGISERTARAITYGEASGATIPAETAAAARMAFRRARAAAIRAELEQLEAECGEPSRGSPASSDGSVIAAGMPPIGAAIRRGG
jgi:hypothetical protein